MTEEQLDTIVGLFLGLQMCMVHLATTLAEKTGISREEIARSFVVTARSVPEDVQNSELVSYVLKRIALGIEHGEACAHIASEIHTLLH